MYHRVAADGDKGQQTQRPYGVLPFSIITGVQWEENHESSVSGPI